MPNPKTPAGHSAPQHLSAGLYLVSQQSDKGVAHYGILDVGNRMGAEYLPLMQPTIIHQRPPRIRIDLLRDTGSWRIHEQIADEAAAIQRIRIGLKTPNYDLFGNNCEHFAQHVATGVRQSRQVQAAVVLAGIAAVVSNSGC